MNGYGLQDDELETLQKRLLHKRLSQSLQESESPNADPILSALAGGIDVLSRNSAAQLDPVATITGLPIKGSANPSAADAYQKAQAVRDTKLRQKALDETGLIKSLEDRKLRMENQKSTQDYRNQQLDMSRERMKNDVILKGQALGLSADRIALEIDKIDRMYDDKNVERKYKTGEREASQEFKSSEGDKNRANAIKVKGTSSVSGGLTPKQIDDQTKWLASQSAQSAGAANTFKELDGALGFNLDGYDPSSGMSGGAKVDLPGKNIPGIGRVSAYDQKARNLDSVVAKLFNIELKDRSGSAVTIPELQRLKQEWSSGRWNNEAELINGLQRAKRAIHEKMQQLEAGVNPVSLQTFESRGGTTSKSMAPRPMAAPAAAKPKTVVQNGITYTWNDKIGKYE